MAIEVFVFQVEAFQFSKFHENMGKPDEGKFKKVSTIRKITRKNFIFCVGKIWKSIKFGEKSIDTTTNFAILFSSKHFKRENGNF